MNKIRQPSSSGEKTMHDYAKMQSTGRDAPHAGASRWLLQASSLAIALGIGVGPAQQALAQSAPTIPTIAPRESATQAVQGTLTPPPGVSITRSADLDTVTVTTTATVLDWNTLDTATLDTTTDYINFLPAGTTLAFEGPGTDFTVLNRIFGTPNAAGFYRGIAMSGNVTSNLSAGGPVGGNIWFYAPGGIFLGNGAAFNVGSLVLTTSQISASVSPTSETINFNGVVDPFSSVIIGEGASINLTENQSNLLIFAPTIEQNGLVDVNGSSIFVSAEEGQVTLRDTGLSNFAGDVRVTQRADSANYILHTGQTTGPARTPLRDVDGTLLLADNHTIYFEGRFADIDMLLSGTVGYREAAAGSVDSNGFITISGVNLDVGSTSFTSSAQILGGNIDMFADTGETITFSNQGFLVLATSDATLGAAAGGVLNIDADVRFYDLFVGGLGPGTFSVVAEADPTGVLAPGSVTITGDLDVSGAISEFDSPFIDQPAIASDIEITVAGGASISIGGDLYLNSYITGSYVYGGYSSYPGGVFAGDVYGGDISVTVADGGSLTVGGILTIDNQASFSDYYTTAYGGTATAGNTTLSFTNASVSLGGLSITSSASGPASSDARPNGGTNDATAGSVGITITGGTVSLGAVSIDTSAVGGDGGSATTGGAAVGGDVSFTSTGSALSVTDLTIVSSGLGGKGGVANSTAPAAPGGTGEGGTISLSSDTTISGLNTLSLNASGTGGQGQTYYSEGGYYAGGVGGIGYGGAIGIIMSGTGTTLQGLSTFDLDVSATGGKGANGKDSFSGGFDGSEGGSGVGGSLSLAANDGALIDLTIVSGLTANGIGGAGGTGGYSYAGPGTSGGNGGIGYGGSVTLTAQGGTIIGDDIDITAAGIGGIGGIGGSYGYYSSGGYYGPSGLNGGGFGGTVDLFALEGSPGIITLGAVSLDASGLAGGGDVTIPTTGGSITLTDTSVSPTGLISMSSLTATAFGSGTVGNFSIAANSGPVSVSNNVDVFVSGSISLNFENDGQLVAGGTTTLDAGTDITITHLANTTPVFSVDSTGDFTATAGGNFTAGPGSIVNSSGEVGVRAEGNLAVDDVRGVTYAILSAGGNATVNDATVTGVPDTILILDNVTAISGLFIIAGSNGAVTPIYDPAANALITGTLTSTGLVSVAAGGNATFQNGSSVLSDNAVIVQTGDDIIVESGASLTSSINPADAPDTDPFADFANLRLQAGSIVNFSGPQLTPISSVVVGGTLNSNAFAIDLSGNAIDARGSTITGSSIRADVADAPNVGVTQLDDAGLLSAPCLEGDVCLGAISADNRVWIGQNSNNDVISLLVESGSVAATSILLTTRNDLSVGTAGVLSTLGATTEFTAESLTGDVDLADATITSDALLISAAGSLLGTASLISTNDIGITVGANLNAASIDTGGQLTTVAGVGGALETNYTVPGSITVGDLTQGALTAVNIIAGGDISFGTITTPNQLIALTAPTGSVFLGTTTLAGANAIDLEGQDIAFNDLVADQQVALTATATGITGTTNGSITAGEIVLDAVTDINVGALAADTNGIQANAGGAITFDTAAATQGGISMTAGGAISGNAVSTVDQPAINDSVAIAAGGLLSLANVTSGGNITLSGVGVNTGNLDAQNGGVLVDATTGIADLGQVDATAGADIAGTSVNLTGANTGLLLRLNATAGDITATGDMTSGAGADLDATGAIAIQDLAAAAQTNLDAGGDIGFTDIALSSGQVAINSGGAVTGTSVTTTANGGVNDAITIIAAGLVNVPTINAGDNISITSAGLTSDLLSAGTGILVDATGAVAVGQTTSGTTANITGTSVTLANGTIGTDLSVAASAGDVALTGIFTVGGAIDLSATGNVSFGTLIGNALFTVLAGGDVTFTEASTNASSLIMNAGGSILGGTANTLAPVANGVADNVSLTAGGDIALTAASSSADLFTANAGGNVTLGGPVAGSTGVSLTGTDVTTQALTSSLGPVTVTASGAADVASATATNDAVTVSGSSVALGSASFGTDLSLTATAGDITGGNFTGGTGTASLDASNAIAIGSIDNVGPITMTAGGDIGFTELLARDGNVSVTAGGAIAGSTVGASGEIDATGDDSVALSAGGSVSLDGATTVLNPFSRAQDSFSVTAGGPVTLGTVSAGTLLSVISSGAVSLQSGTSGDNLELSGTSVTVGTATVGGSLVVDAVAGDIALTGAVGVANAVDLTATGNIGFATLTAGNGALSADAGGDISFTSASATGAVDLAAGGDVSGGDAQAGSQLTVDGTNVALGTASGATGVAITASNDATFTSLSSSTGNVDVSAGGLLGGGAVDAAGDIGLLSGANLTATNLVAGGNIDVSATGTPSIDDFTAGGDVSITGSTLALKSGNAGGALSLTALGGDIDSTTGTFVVGTDISLTASGNILFDQLATPGGSFTADAGGDIAFDSVTTNGSATASAGGDIAFNSVTTSDGPLSLAAGGSINGGTVSTLAAGTGTPNDVTLSAASNVTLTSASSSADNVTVDAGGSISITSLAAQGDMDLVAGSGIASTGTLEAGGNAALSTAAGPISLATLVAPSAQLVADLGPVSVAEALIAGLLEATGSAVSLASSEDLLVTAQAFAGDIDIAANGNLIVIDAQANGDITLQSGGSVGIANSATGTVTVPSGFFSPQAVTSGSDITVSAAQDIVVSDQVSADGSVSLSAGGLIDIGGAVVGTNIATSSSDLDIGTAGTLGDFAQTQAIAINSEATDMTLGGDGSATGFVLSQEEIARIFSGGDLTISLAEASTSGAQIVIADLNVVAGDESTPGQFASDGTLFISSVGGVNVEGEFTVLGAGSETLVGIDAGTLLRIDTTSGNIRTEDSDGSPAGSLALFGQDIQAISESAAQDLSGTPEVVDARLAMNDGILRDEGMIQTGSLTLKATGTLLIQNTGEGVTHPERRGFVVDSVTIINPEGNTRIIINGTIGGATGLDAVDLAEIEGSFEPGSTINGCEIGLVSFCFAQTVSGFPEEIQDLIEEQILESTSTSPSELMPVDESSIGSILIDIADQPEFQTDPLIDEPVTGAGNDDLWSRPRECTDPDGNSALCIEGE